MTKQRRILSAVLALAMTGMSFSGVVNADSVNENNSDVIEKWTNMTEEESEKEWQSYQFIFDIHQKVKEAFNEKLTGYVYSFGIYTNPDDPSKSIEYIEVGDEKTKEEVINILTEAGISESYYEVNISQAGPPQILVATASNTDTQNKADAKESEALNNKTTEESNNKVPENMDEYQKKNDELVEKWMNMTEEESEKEWQSYQFIFDIHQKVKEAFNEKLTGYVYSFGIYTNPEDPSKSIEYIEVGDEKTKEEVINILTEAGISESYYEVNISQAGPPQTLLLEQEETDPELAEKTLNEWKYMNENSDMSEEKKQAWEDLNNVKNIVSQIRDEWAKTEEYKLYETGSKHTHKDNYVELTVCDEKTKNELINILNEKGIKESNYKIVVDPNIEDRVLSENTKYNVDDNAGENLLGVAYSTETEDITSEKVSYGDLNDDGTADLTDLTLLSLYLMKSADFTDSQIEAADIDGSGEVDIADLAYFKQYVCKDAAVASKIRIGIKNNDDHGNIQDGGDYSKVEHEQGEEGFSGAREATPEQIAESLNQPEKD